MALKVSAVLSLFAAGRETGVVVEKSGDMTHIVPIHTLRGPDGTMGPSRILQRDQVGDTPLHEAINETIKKCTAGEEVPDEASGNHYYWNNVTDETSWERPTASSRQPK